MKKLLCVTLSILLLLSIMFMPCASAVETPFDLFSEAINSLRWYSPFWDVAPGEAFPLVSIMPYMKKLMCTEEYGKELITEDGYSYFAYYAIPADVFEAAAMDCFGIVDLEAMRHYTSFFWDYINSTGIDNFQNYQPEEQVYLFSIYGGMGDPSWYEVLGYTEEDGMYTVYSRFVSLIWGEPEGVEGEDYIQIGEDYYEITHYLCTVMTVSNGRAQFHSWQELSALPDVELITPSDKILQTEQVTIEAAPGVFPADTVIEVREPDAAMLELTQQALSQLVDSFVAFDFVSSAQPNGVAKVTFTIPQGYDPEKLALFYISDDGVAQQLDATVNVEAGTITAELIHFSVYAVAQLTQTEPVAGDINRDGKVDARDARLILLYVAGLADEAELDLDAADITGDASVNARDARAILKLAAGLE